MIGTEDALRFLGFVQARHEVWARRQSGEPAPWTADPIVSTRKFTNVFRILDPGTQFILTDLEEPGISRRDLLMRLFLYRHTGRIEAWEYLEVMMGRYPLVEDLDEALECWREYRDSGKPFFTGAYLVFPQSHTPGSDKLESIVRLTQRLFDPASPDDVMPLWEEDDDPGVQFYALRRNKGVADFMSMQVLTDWGYTAACGEDRENDFVVPGPGCRKGAKFLDPDRKAEEVIPWAAEAIGYIPSVYIRTSTGRLRRPSYMDAQNCLCEYSKYVRFADKPIPAQPYQTKHRPVTPLFPEHWG